MVGKLKRQRRGPCCLPRPGGRGTGAYTAGIEALCLHRPYTNCHKGPASPFRDQRWSVCLSSARSAMERKGSE